jgi:hypothetical protein
MKGGLGDLRFYRPGVLLALGAVCAHGGSWELNSPEGDLRLVVELLAGDGHLEYRIERQGAEVVAASPLGIEWRRDGGGELSMAAGLTVVEVRRGEGLREAFEQPRGKQRRVDLDYHVLELVVENHAGERMSLEARAFAEGIGLRYRMHGSGRVTLIREHTGIRLPEGTTGWLQYKDFPGMYAPNYQDPVERMPAGKPSPQNGFVLPGLFQIGDGPHWLLFHESGLTRDYYGAHLESPTPDRLYRIAQPHPGEGNGIGAVVPTSELPLDTPWRLFAVGELATVATTNLVEALADPYDARRFGAADWIVPGKAAWSWWSQDTGTPALQYRYIDFAAAQGWEHVLIDANWDQWPNATAEVPALVEYARERGVRIHLWYNSGGPHSSVSGTPRNRMSAPLSRRAEMDRIAAWGVSGIKVDFFFSDKQDRIRQYLEIMEEALERRLLVNFHGATVPRGWSRTYPNLLTVEAVAGAENYKWPPGPVAPQNVRYTFTRNVVGPMDYTPLTFAAAWNLSGIPYAHQLALAVAFESGIQHFADQADGDTAAGYGLLFATFPEVAPFLSGLPVAWDETRLIEGHPDTHAVWARRRGEIWYVGAINGANTPRTVELALAGLVAEPVRVEAFTQGAAGNQLQHADSLHQPDETLFFPLQTRGGFTLRIQPVESPFDTRMAALTDDLTLRAPGADLDRDGIPNLLEYALGLDPANPADRTAGRLPALMTGADGRLSLRFGIDPQAAPARFEIQYADNPAFDGARAVPAASLAIRSGGWIHWPLPEGVDPLFVRLIVRD